MLTVTEEQALFFRSSRSQLVSGAANAVEAAGAVVGAQAQQLKPALLALSQRITGGQTATELEAQLLSVPSPLVRTWGQRDTLHIYDADRHWMKVVASRPQLVQTGRRGLMPSQESLDAALDLFVQGGELTRRELFPLLSDEYLAEVAERAGPGKAAQNFGAGRLIWRLAHQGHLCLTRKDKAEQYYVARAHRFPALAWPDALPEPDEAAASLAADYLRVYGPATVQDIGHHFGATVTSARGWVQRLQPGLRKVTCGDRADLLLLEEDADALAGADPGSPWPTRLLPLFDTMLMGHADKSWTAPVVADRKRIWRKAAMVAATVLHRGKVVGLWKPVGSGRTLKVLVEKLSGWNREAELALEAEVAAVARHLGKPSFDIAFGVT